MPAQVVLSYPLPLFGQARRLRAELESVGLSVWSLEEDLPLGVRLEEAVAREVARASALVVLVDTHSGLGPEQVELAAVLPPTLVVPVLIGTGIATMPEALASYRSLRLDHEDDIARIAAAVGNAVAQVPVAEAGDPPAELVEALRLGSCVLVLGGEAEDQGGPGMRDVADRGQEPRIPCGGRRCPGGS